MVFLIRKIGDQRARQLLLSGDLISSQDALSNGLIFKLSDKTSIASDVRAFANKIIKNNSAQALLTTKQMIADVQSLPLDEALKYAARMNADARATEDCRIGIASFLNKQSLEW
jgi:methylglutaconyl-CoA hydratase